MSRFRPVMRLVMLSVVLFAAAMLCLARETNPPANAASPKPSDLIVRVITPDGAALDGSSNVSLSGENASAGQKTGTFHSNEAQFLDIAPGGYKVSVTAPGYKPGSDQITVDGTGGQREAFIRMDPMISEPSVLNELSVTQVPDDLRKRVIGGMLALQKGKLKSADKTFKKAYNDAPRNPTINYLRGYTLLRLGQTADAGTYLSAATSIDPKYAAAFVSLGDLHVKLSDLAGATELYERAISLDGTNWRARWSLAQLYMQRHEFDQARTAAEGAVTAGRGAANGAELIVAEAWASSGDHDKTVSAFESFAEDSPEDASASVAPVLAALKDQQDADKTREEISAIANREFAKFQSSWPNPTQPPTPATILPDPNTFSTTLTFPLPPWAPRGVGETQPAVDPGANCSLASVQEKAGTSVQNLVKNIDQIDASEKLDYQELNEFGRSVDEEIQKHDYLATFDEIRPGNLTLDELRDAKPGYEAFPGGLAPSGLVTMAIIMHPYLHDDYQMFCEGLGDWRGRPSWIIYFRQRDGRPGRLSGYTIDGHTHPLSLKGRVWVSADTYEVIHIETDLVKPMPEIHLNVEHNSADYLPVLFHAAQTTIWLPSTADMYTDFRNKRVHIRDSFSNYKLFTVGVYKK